MECTNCLAGLTGPYCALCAEPDVRYYDRGKRACLRCTSAESLTPLIILSVLFGCLLCVFICHEKRKCAKQRQQQQQQQRQLRIRGHTRSKNVRRRLRRIAKSVQRQLTTKIKVLFSFYQVVTKVGETYIVTYPRSVEQILEAFAFTNFELAGLGLPLACLNLGSFESKLIFMMSLPVGAVLLLI